MLGIMRVPITVALLVGLLGPAQAAQKITEPFTTGGNGWTGTPTAVFRYLSGAVRVQFAAVGAGVPGNAIFTTTTNAADAAFRGDYRAAGIQSIGFSMIASSEVPSGLHLYLKSYPPGATNVIVHSLGNRVVQTGVWYTIMLSLSDAGLGGWTESPSGCFTSVLADVYEIQLYSDQNGINAQRYQIDNFFLDGLPSASFMEKLTNENAVITWSGLRSNLVYSMQTAPSVDGDWSNVTTFAATGTAHTLSTPPVTNGPPGYFRLQQ
jgi:hypothetical protein